MTRSIIHLTLVALVIATSAHARTLEVGENKEFKMPSAAAAIAQDGDHVEIQPGEYFDCVVWSANKLVVEGIGDPDKVIVTDKTCQGKALFRYCRRRHHDPQPYPDPSAGTGRQWGGHPGRGQKSRGGPRPLR